MSAQPSPLRPDDFVNIAKQAGALVRNGHGSRVVIRYQNKTIGFSRRGNDEYPRQYRIILKHAFKAMGLLALLISVFRLFSL